MSSASSAAKSAAEPVLVLTGPTASGKSDLALPVAERLGAEILSLDSMAVYRRMDVGTAKPDAGERARVPHHLIDLVEPWEHFDTARYLAAAEAVLADVRARGRRALFVGGTALYLMGLRKGFFSGPSADPALRSRLEAEELAQPGTLHARLMQVDPDAAARIHRNDLRRLVRALEVFERTGQTITARQQQFAAQDRFDLRLVAVRVTREEVSRRIKARTQRMFQRGLLDEVKAIVAAGGFSRQAGQAIGYAQCLEFLAGRLRSDALVESVQQATRQLVRKQETWFRKMTELRQVEGSVDAVLAAFTTP
jgi:tRNA dimethylallyltransferase